MMKWRGCRYQRDTTLLLIEKHLERQRGGGGCRRCWGLSDTRLIRGSSSEVVVCTMKYVDGPTMTHMLRLTGVDLDMGEDLKKKEEEKPWITTESFTTRSSQNFPVGLPVRAPTYWFDLRQNALSLLISGLDRLSGDGEQ